MSTKNMYWFNKQTSLRLSLPLDIYFLNKNFSLKRKSLIFSSTRAKFLSHKIFSHKLRMEYFVKSHVVKLSSNDRI